MKHKFIARTSALIVSISIVLFVIVSNDAPFSTSRTYASNNKNALALGPSNRVQTINNISKQTDDLIYFSSSMPLNFSQANVRVAFKNPSPNQQITLGYQDQDVWHYNSQILDSPLLDSLNWPKVGGSPYLYQKIPAYKSTNDFLNNPPKNKVVGVFDYADSEFLQPSIVLSNYKPASAATVINTPLRGTTTMYAYLDNEPFKMNITKQDLNWYPDPDTVTISVYKGVNKVFETTIDDDGNSSANHEPGPPQTVGIQNPGPGLPESGVYKIVINAPGDSLITKISTNLHKIVFAGPLYVANNSVVYGEVVKQTKPTNLTTNAQNITLRSDHTQSTQAVFGGQNITLAAPKQVYSASSLLPTNSLIIPNSDMTIDGVGYFAFSPDQFFTPTPYKILPINSADDLAQVDYVLTNYVPPTRQNGWLVAQRSFDISNAVTQKRQLSWLLSAPGLKINNSYVEYKQITMTLSKKGWLAN